MRSVRLLPILLLLLCAALGSAQYYATKSGKKYHTSRLCSALKSSKEILTVTLADIQRRHLTLCSKCSGTAAKSTKTKKLSGITTHHVPVYYPGKPYHPYIRKRKSYIKHYG